MTVAVVTDSTACLPSYRIEQARISVVPVQVIIDERAFSEGVDITSLAVNTALRDERDVTTSKPSVEAFASIYRELAFGGATDIVSVHLSSELSGTYSSAVLAAREAQIPVRVVDSRTIGLGLGFAALAAADAALAGREVNDVAELAQRVGRASRAWLFVDTLDFLRRGGRIGAAQAAVGSALSIKPILEIAGGRVVPCDKVRTTARAHQRLIELAVGAAGDLGGRVEIGVQHAGAREAAEGLAASLGKALPGIPVVVADLGAVLSAHAGPGALAVIVSPVM
jgi:DegV family protein with EDD domain